MKSPVTWTSQSNLLFNTCNPWKLRPACASMQSEKTSLMAPITLNRPTGWFASLLVSKHLRQVFLQWGSNDMWYKLHGFPLWGNSDGSGVTVQMPLLFPHAWRGPMNGSAFECTKLKYELIPLFACQIILQCLFRAISITMVVDTNYNCFSGVRVLACLYKSMDELSNVYVLHSNGEVMNNPHFRQANVSFRSYCFHFLF